MKRQHSSQMGGAEKPVTAPVTAMILTVGDEILIGQIVDSNSAFIGERLTEIGVQVTGIQSLSDSLGAIIQGVRGALKSADVVIMTGGLGPTKDDITKSALCQLFGVGLRRDMGVYAHLERFLAGRGVDFNELNQAQADVVEGCEALHNEVGTAPGMVRLIEDFAAFGSDPEAAKSGRKKLLFCLPGVPFEMKNLMETAVLPRITAEFGLEPCDELLTALVYGLPESVLAQRIEGWESGCRAMGLSLAYLPNPRGIRLRLGGAGREQLMAQFAELQSLIPDFYLGLEPTSIEAEVARLLQSHSLTLSIAESCTGGAVSARCTALSGASGWYYGGVVSYDNSVKINTLGVTPQTLNQYGAVSEQTVTQMATGVCERLGTHCAIATSGIAGPNGDGGSKKVGDVYIAIKVGEKIITKFQNNGQPREMFIQRTASSALNLLRLALLEL